MSSCAGDLVQCEESCIDPQTSNNYCGAYGGCATTEGTACGSTEVCISGNCVDCTTFAAVVSTSGVTYAPQALALGHLNSDAHLDAVVALGESGPRVLLGDGSGAFDVRPAISSANSTWASTAVLYDLDGDTNLDLVTNLFHATGAGDGTLGTPAALGTRSARNALPADLDGDGFVDIVMTDRTTLWVLLSDEHGNFNTSETFTAEGNIAVGDINGDNRVDIVTTGGDILTNDGDGTFTSGSSYAALSGALSIELADLDGRNGNDIVVGASGSVKFLPNEGLAAFANLTPIHVSGGYYVKVGDINNDEHLDIVAASGTSITLLLGDGTGSFRDQPELTVPDNNSTSDLALGDLNGDGRLDIAVCSPDNLVYAFLASPRSGCQ